MRTLLFQLGLLTVLLSSCVQVLEMKTFEVTYQSSDQIVVYETNWEDFEGKIVFEDESYLEFSLNLGLIHINDVNKLNEVGSHIIRVSYEDYETTFEIEVVENQFTLLMQSIYQTSQDTGAFEGTYEAWLETVVVIQGNSGREVLFQVADGYIQWQYTGEATWTNLVELTTLIGVSGQDGVDGINGTNGTDGLDGETVVFQVADGYIQWQYTGEATWTNLVELTTLIGVSGQDGVDGINGTNGTDGLDGETVLFQVADGYIQWQYTGQATWTNLVELTTLIGVSGQDGVDGINGTNGTDGTDGLDGINGTNGTNGTDGLDGTNGQSAYEIYIETYPDYLGDETQWLFDLINGNLGIKSKYTVTFDSNGGTSVESQEIEDGKKANRPGEPSRIGYSFAGWFIDENEPWIFIGYDVTEDVTLIARWTINQYTITFDTDGGSAVSAITQDYDTEVTTPSNPTKEGYTFDGWSEDIPEVMPAENLTFTATWTINQYAISYKTNEVTLFISLGNNHTASLTSLGRVFTWGNNSQGQLGDDTTTNRTTPTDITSQFLLTEGETIISLSLGYYHSSALTSTGRVFTWGVNGQGQLGDGTTTNRTTPTDITSRFSLTEGETIISLSLGSYHSSAITSTGRVFIWGRNSQFQLGDGTTSNRTTPTDITSHFLLTEGETIISLSLAINHSSALTSTGRVFTWGHNSEGELGDGTITNRSTPIDITRRFPLTEGEIIMSLSLGYYYSSALTSTGRVFTWGFNDYGQLGDGSTSNRTTPTDITSQFLLSEGEIIMSLSFGGSNSSVLTSTGRVFTFGRNSEGELGDDTTTERTTPTDITYTIEILNLIFSFNYEEDITSYYIPVLEGYTFEGWYTDLTLTTKYVFNTMPAEDLVLYAKWI